MVFTQFGFFIFFLLVFGIHWNIKTNHNRKVFLLFCSYCFYSFWDWRFLGLIFISTFVDYFIGIQLSRTDETKKRKSLLLVSLAINLGILFIFKYFNFFISSATDFMNLLGIQANHTTLNIILPAGISFYTFQTLSYTIDVYRKEINACKDKLDFALFVAFFPQLVAGPIVRASDFIPQLKTKTDILKTNFKVALWIFTFGFIKKACIADNISVYVDAFYSHPTSYDKPSSWLATILYAIQIYCDFSGYSDMAIAVAAMLGYKLCNNFAHPYFSLNITEFWRRWHMSLSSWLRDYLYISLGGNRISRLRTEINLLITMLLGGLWHGASWNFVIWGGLHGLALISHKLFMRSPGRFVGPPVFSLLTRVLVTCIFVNFCWVFFRAKTLGDSISVIQQMTGTATAGSGALPYGLFYLVAACAVAHFIEYRYQLTTRLASSPALFCASLLGVTWAVIMLFIPVATVPFIYFQF